MSGVEKNSLNSYIKVDEMFNAFSFRTKWWTLHEVTKESTGVLLLFFLKKILVSFGETRYNKQNISLFLDLSMKLEKTHLMFDQVAPTPRKSMKGGEIDDSKWFVPSLLFPSSLAASPCSMEEDSEWKYWSNMNGECGHKLMKLFFSWPPPPPPTLPPPTESTKQATITQVNKMHQENNYTIIIIISNLLYCCMSKVRAWES